MSNLKELNDSNYKEKLEGNSRLSIVKFGAEWCGPCKSIKPILESLASKHKDVDVFEVDVDSNPEITGQYQVQGIPALFFVKDNQIIDSFAGFRPEDAIEKSLLKHKN